MSLVGPNNVSSGPDECFKPLIFQACVSLTGRAEDQRLVTVLRDTACSQSLILSKILPLSAMSACNMSAVVRGIEMRSMPSPLHSFHIMSGLVTGFFPVAVRASFPIDGVHLIMGNDLAGSKVFPVPEVVRPILCAHYDCRAKHHPGAMVAKALTGAPSPRRTHTAPNSWFSDPAEGRLPPAGGAVVCRFQEPNITLPSSLVKGCTVTRKTVRGGKRYKRCVNQGVPRWVSQPGGVSGVT